MVKRSSKKHKHKENYLFSVRYHLLTFSLACIAFGIFAGVINLIFSRSVHGVFCANSMSCIKDLSGTYDKKAKDGVFMGQKVVPPSFAAVDPIDNTNVLGASVSDKHIYVDLTDQRLYAFEGNRTVFNFLVSTGKWNHTPTGDFHIWIKLRYANMVGGDPSNGTYYNLPNVPYTMYLYNDQYPKTEGYGIHGTYWHHNFGHPMSHGCVNMKTEEAAQLYAWADPPTAGNATLATDSNPGTEVTIYGVTPNN